MSDTMTDTPPVVRADTPDEARKKMALYLGLTIGLIVVDQLTKYVVQRTLPLWVPVPVMGDFFRLTYIFNRGAAFGIHLGEWSRIAFSILPVAAAVLLYLMYRQTPWSDRTRLVAIALVTGGAIGNLIDRIRSSRGVVDFFDFGVGNVRWPVFNVADIGVTVGALLLAVSLWREEQTLEQQKEAAASPPGAAPGARRHAGADDD
ncbi:MAG: signal peptidase II [Gemmatimonadetes bacterium]|nr:signal peptidase II [Gemmatimonadota bacterium]